jgi:hypothetical protein
MKKHKPSPQTMKKAQAIKKVQATKKAQAIRRYSLEEGTSHGGYKL